MKMKIVVHAECIIQSVKDDNIFGERLIQMGVLPGSHLKIIRIGFRGRTVEVMIDQGQSIALRSKEMEMLNCKMIAIPLVSLSSEKGKKYRIKSFTGGQGFMQKMKDRGLHISDSFDILGDHPFKLNTLHGVITIGRGEAEKIIVEPVN